MMLISFSACQSSNDFFTLSKKNQSDEFLIEKKDPLILPPDYKELPIPGDDNKDLIVDDDQNIKSIIGDNKISIDNANKNSENLSIEKSILDKIDEID
jgi:hypothetical protein